VSETWLPGGAVLADVALPEFRKTSHHMTK